MSDLWIQVGDTLPALCHVEAAWLLLVVQHLWQQGLPLPRLVFRRKKLSGARLET